MDLYCGRDDYDVPDHVVEHIAARRFREGVDDVAQFCREVFAPIGEGVRDTATLIS